MSIFKAMQSPRPIPCVNASGEDVPVGAAVIVTGLNSDGRMVIDKPDVDNHAHPYFNIGPVISASGGQGIVAGKVPLWALYDSGDGTPTNGDTLGTQAGSWKLHKDNTGMIAWGGADGQIVYVQRELSCGCFCSTTTSRGTGGAHGGPSTGKIMYCRITSSAFPTPQVFVVLYTPEMYVEVNSSIVATIPFTLTNWPMIAATDPHQEGWWIHSQIATHPVLHVLCSPGNFYFLLIEIRRCDMKFYVTQSRLINQLTTPETRYKVYTQCDDPDDIIRCDPFYVRRKMDFFNAMMHPNPAIASIYYNEPLTSCTGTGSDCTGEDYMELFLSEPNPWYGDWDGDWDGDWYG